MVAFQVQKNMPDYDSYLVFLQEDRVLALLPRIRSVKNYRIGETGWATVYSIDGPRVVLSQTSPQYVKYQVEFHVKRVHVHRMARCRDATWVKVAVSVEYLPGETWRDFLSSSQSEISNLDNALNAKVILVEFSLNKKQFILNALLPAPVKAVKDVILLSNNTEAEVYVPAEHAGKFLGSRGANVSAAGKLVNIELRIIPFGGIMQE